jgi:hypothetical protein
MTPYEMLATIAWRLTPDFAPYYTPADTLEAWLDLNRHHFDTYSVMLGDDYPRTYEDYLEDVEGALN